MTEHYAIGAAAGWWRRFLSFWYEILLLVAIVLLVGALGQTVFQIATGLPVTSLTDLWWARVLNFIWLMAWVFAWFALCWRKGGQTLAMKAWRIRITMHDSAQPGWRAICVRFFMACLFYGPVIPLWVLAWHDARWLMPAWLALGWSLAPFVWAWFDREQQLLHDRIAGTRLVIAKRHQRKTQPQQQA